LLALAVAISVQLVGTLLTFALLVTPAAAAQQLTARPIVGLLLSVVLALAVAWAGLAVAYFSVYPVGFFVTSFAFGAYLISRGVRWGRVRGFGVWRKRASVPA
jgi:zinc/manganese transport system permease protein